MFRILLSYGIALIVFLAGTAYTLTQTKIYEASGSLNIRGNEQNENTNQLRDYYKSPLEHAFNILESNAIARGVSERLSEKELRRFFAYYPQDSEIISILHKNRSFQQIPDTFVVRFSYRHPDPEVAAIISNIYMKEYVDYILKSKLDASMKWAESVRI